MLSTLQMFMDGVVPQRQESNTNLVRLAGPGLDAGDITNRPVNLGAPWASSVSGEGLEITPSTGTS